MQHSALKKTLEMQKKLIRRLTKLSYMQILENQILHKDFFKKIWNPLFLSILHNWNTNQKLKYPGGMDGN